MTAQFFKIWTSLFLFASTLTLPAGAGAISPVIYVNGAAASSGDGASWATARKTITEALASATTGTQIWVARGTYATTHATSITLKNQVALYGGFRGNETNLSARNIKTNPTVIDATPPDSGLAAPHAVILDHVRGVTLDGFTVRGGLATAAFTGGGGIYCNQVDASSVIRNCLITSNTAELADGAGLCLVDSALQVTSCVITHNAVASGLVSKRGGGVIAQGGAPVFIGCVISDNAAPYGGGVYGDNTALTLDRCTLSGNSATIGGGLDLDRGSALVTQSQILGNRAVRYGAGLASSRTALSLGACTLGANVAIGEASAPPFYGGGLTARTGSLSMLNCLVSGNTVLQGTSSGSGLCLYGLPATLAHCTLVQSVNSELSGISAQGMTSLRITGSILSANDQTELANSATGAAPVLANCLFYANTDLTVPQGNGNILGNAQFAQSLAGYWTAAPQYDGRSNRTTLAAAGAAFTPGALAGRFVTPNAARSGQALVTSNTATLIQVAGDATSLTAKNILFQLTDARPGYASAALDAITTGPATDLPGTPRPVDLPGIGANGTGTEFDIGAFEVKATTRPALQVLAAGGVLDLGRRDPDSGPSAPLTLTVRNNGFAALTFSGAGFKITGANAASFAFTAAPALTALAPGARRDVALTFDPTAVGPHQALLTITTNDPMTPSVTVLLLGFGSYVAPVLAAEPAYTPGSANTVAWAAAKGARGYTVQCGTGAVAGTGLFSSVDLSSLTLKTTFTGLADRTTYWYRARATYGGGLVSDWSAPTTSTQDASLPAVSALVASPAIAYDNQAVTITFTINKHVSNLAVTVNTHAATLVRLSDGGELADHHYVYRFVMPSTDVPGLARIAISGTDHFGNPLAFTDRQALVKAGTIYVNRRAAAGGNGASWATAYRTIGAALAAAGQGSAIWVASGRYSESIWLKTGVTLYGGFKGNETSLDQRNWRLNQTWLDAAHAAAGGWPAEHALGIVGCTDVTVDGLWITGAYSDLYSSAGGAVYLADANMTCQLIQCVITGNTADGIPGAGLFLEQSTARITSCTIVNNTALDAAGGGVALDQCRGNQTLMPIFEHCLIAGNSAATGGALYANESLVALADCALTGNRADFGGACYFENQSGLKPTDALTLVNCTLDDNASGGGFFVRSGVKAILNNVAFTDNTGFAIYDYDEINSLTLVNCLFHGSVQGVYRAATTSTTLTAAAQLNSHFAGSSGNLDGVTNLLTGIGGQWAAAPVFDAATTRTILQAAGTPFTPATLAGRVIDLYGDMHTLAVITSNTASVIQVAGDWRALTSVGAPFQLLDLRPGAGSAAIDATTFGPNMDMYGTPRPIDIPGVGANGTFTEFDIGAGEGAWSANPRLIVSAAGGKLDFGGLLPGAPKSAPRTVTLRNLGYAPLSFTGAGISLSGPGAADFSFSSTPAITSLAAGATRTLSITFTPSAQGLRTATLTLTTNDPALPTLTLQLSGYRALAAPVMLAEPTLSSTTVNTVSWSAVAQAHHYTAQCSTEADFSGPVTLDNIPSATPAGTFTGLTESRLYHYRVRAVDAYGLPGPWSNPVSSTQDPTPPRVTITANVPNPTLAHTLVFSLHFSEIIRPFSTADLAVIGTIPASSVALSLSLSGQNYLVTAVIGTPLASGTVGIRLGERIRDLAGNPLADTASALYQVKAPATVIVRPIPAAACSWSLAGPNYFSAAGTGEQTVAVGWAGSYTLQWTPAAGWAAEPGQTFRLVEGQTLVLTRVLIPTAAGPQRDRALVLRYLLGLASNPAGLDANGDGRVNVLDLLYHEGRFAPDAPALVAPASGSGGVRFTDTLRWTACQYAVTYDLYIWKDGATTATTPVLTGLTANSCVFPARSFPGGPAYNMRYRWYVLARNTRAQTASPAWTLVTEPNPLQVVTPNGGESLTLGTTTTVHWKINTARAGKQVRLELWRNGAANRTTSFGLFATTTGDTTSNVRTTTTLTAAKDYKIRVVSTQMEKAGEVLPYDESDKLFELKK